MNFDTMLNVMDTKQIVQVLRISKGFIQSFKKPELTYFKDRRAQRVMTSEPIL